MTATARAPRGPKTFKTQAEARDAYLAQAGEVSITNLIVEHLKGQGFLVFHDQDPKRNERGLSDILALGTGILEGLIVVWEMKTTDRRSGTTKEQRNWLRAWRKAGVDAGVVRTTAWQNGEIAAFVREARQIGRKRVRGVMPAWPRLPSLEVVDDEQE